MKTTLSLALALCSTIAAQASYLPFFDGIRAAILDRQVAISNAAPFDAAEKKELNTLKVALKTVDKPSTTLKGDLTAMAKVVAGINTGASNETFSAEFRAAISNYAEVLVETNNALVAELEDANNNPALKDKAADAIEAAAAALAAIQPETDLNGAAKALGAVLKQYLSATKAVTAAVNAKPAPTPTPKAGSLVLVTGGNTFVDQCQAFTRNAEFTAFPMSTNGMVFSVEIPSNGKPGTYNVNLLMPVQLNGQAGSIVLSDVPATITAASSTAIVGHFSTTASFVPPGGAGVPVEISVRFNGKVLSFGR
jgi:hypothetical protein